MRTKVPQLEPWIGKEEYRAIKSCFDKKWITEGPLSKKFVEKILKLTGAKYGVLAPNGTLALYLALRAVGIGPGDEVIVPDFTFMGSATAVEMTGATPVFADVNRRNFQIEADNIEKVVTKKTKAVMPVHIYGTIANMKDIVKVTKKHGLKVVEDACEAVGVFRDGKHAGTFGDTGCLSFFADKTITTGEGGFIMTNKKDTYENLLYLRNQGRVNRGSFIHPRIGYNFRMTDVQCAVGLAQLKKLATIKRVKLQKLALYKKFLKGLEGITYFEPDNGADFIPFRTAIVCKDAHELMEYMKSKGIEPRTFFYPLHRQPCFSGLKRKYKYTSSDFPNSLYGYKHGVCLPVFPSLTKSQIEYICTTIRRFYNEGQRRRRSSKKMNV